MKLTCLLLLLFLLSTSKSFSTPGDDNTIQTGNTRQYYSGKIGFFSPSDGLNNGLLIGIDGITEFTHYNFILAGAIDFYPKQSIDIFTNSQQNGAQPLDVTQQQIFLLPIHVNVGYKIFEIADADSRAYLGFGGGYYFYFYGVTYRSSNGGLLGSGSETSDTKNGGAVFGSIFGRILINQIFVEPRIFFASKSEDTVNGSTFVVNPSGFAITLGFQYH